MDFQQDNISSQQPPMKWYKFLVYFLLIISALINFLNAPSYFTGSRYMVDGANTAPIVYATFKGLKFLDITMGILTIVFAAYIVYVRTMLVSFKKQAPDLIVSMYIINAILAVFYPVALYAITNVKADFNINMPVSVVSAVTSLIMAYLNYVYFKKRKSLFVN